MSIYSTKQNQNHLDRLVKTKDIIKLVFRGEVPPP